MTDNKINSDAQDRILTELKLLEEEYENKAELTYLSLCTVMNYAMEIAPTMVHGAHMIYMSSERVLRDYTEELEEILEEDN
tara:strand:+ start:555 stop:797 length:243 start_codon:yes stop_codon:yes gene_type:complete